MCATPAMHFGHPCSSPSRWARQVVHVLLTNKSPTQRFSDFRLKTGSVRAQDPCSHKNCKAGAFSLTGIIKEMIGLNLWKLWIFLDWSSNFSLCCFFFFVRSFTPPLGSWCRSPVLRSSYSPYEFSLGHRRLKNAPAYRCFSVSTGASSQEEDDGRLHV